jgi:hypothetical protein
MKTTLIRFIITLYLLGNSYVLRSMDHFFIDTITKFQSGELNCGNFNDESTPKSKNMPQKLKNTK